MSTRPAAGSAPPTFLEIDAQDIARYPGLIDDMMLGRALGIIVRRVFDPAALARIVADLAEGRTALRPSPVAYFKGQQYGHTLVIAPPDLRDYFTESVAFRAACATLFAGGRDFEAGIREVLQVLGTHRPVAPPVGPGGVPYGLATIRVLGEGGAIDLHCENETLRFPAMAHLATVIDPRTQLSFYVPLALPESGGELQVYALEHGVGEGAALHAMRREDPATLRYVEDRGVVVPRPGVGDLLLFDAGRHFHRVSRVQGARSRWTMGGFVALSQDRERLLYWG